VADGVLEFAFTSEQAYHARYATESGDFMMMRTIARTVTDFVCLHHQFTEQIQSQEHAQAEVTDGYESVMARWSAFLTAPWTATTDTASLPEWKAALTTALRALLPSASVVNVFASIDGDDDDEHTEQARMRAIRDELSSGGGSSNIQPRAPADRRRVFDV
jgi:hypothetical protein